MTARIFAENVQAYLDRGLEPRPIPPGEKGPREKGWNKPNAEFTEGIFDRWAANRDNYGIGLRLGTVLSDGTVLAALDIDDDLYVRAARFLPNDAPCGRIGSKGIAYFVRLRGELRQARLPFDVDVPAGKVHVGELLGPGAFVVVPPTIHPSTGQPYRWVGRPLLDVACSELPIIEV